MTGAGVGESSGPPTFLFTDIEGSTQLVHRIGDRAYAELLEEHRTVLRTAIETHDGREVNTEGDALFAVFRDSADGVCAAVGAQRALASERGGERDVRVRMGLHTGAALARNGDFVGHAVHRAQRICAAAHGGQIVCSAAAVELAGLRLPDGVSLSELGLHRLKDLGEPERLFQVVADGLQVRFPPLRSMEAYLHNLPVQRSSFVGQRRSLAELPALLAARRLVTLTGVGGCGKTRLALQLAADQLDLFPDGAFFAELAPISDPSLIWRTIASAAGMPLAGAASGRPLSDDLCAFFGARRVLLVLDNCEHLLDAAAGAVDLILSRCPRVTILATSREALEAEGEHTWRVPSLAVPEPGEPVLEAEAVRLFCDRAAAVRAGFSPSDHDENAVVDICRRLDGIPLAIELAAARIAHLSPGQIAQRLQDRFRLLTGGRRVQRQQTLQAAMDWSHDLLSPDERALLRRLAVFSGHFSLEAAEGICDGDPVAAAAVLDLLGSLVAKSLVIAEQLDEAERYSLLETVRLYAEQKLVEVGEADPYRTRHRDWYLACMEARPLEETVLTRGFHNFVATELDNLRTALHWSLGEERRDLVARLAGAMAVFWPFGGHHDEGHRWLQEALAGGSVLTTDQRVTCLAAESWVGMIRLDPALDDYAKGAVDAAEGRPSWPVVVAMDQRALYWSSLAAATRQPEHAAVATRFADDGLRVARAGLPPIWEGYALTWEGAHWLIQGDIDRAIDILRGVASTVDWDYTAVATTSTVSLAAALYVSGDVAGGLDAASRAAHRSGTQSPFGPVGQMVTLAVCLAGTGNADQARAVLVGELETAKDSGVPLLVNDCLVGFAALAWYDDQLERASRLLARALGGDDPVIRFRSPASYALWRYHLGLVRGRLDPDTARRCRDEGRRMSQDEAIAEALGGA